MNHNEDQEIIELSSKGRLMSTFWIIFDFWFRHDCGCKSSDEQMCFEKDFS
jgi:hypothetical protein